MLLCTVYENRNGRPLFVRNRTCTGQPQLSRAQRNDANSFSHTTQNNQAREPTCPEHRKTEPNKTLSIVTDGGGAAIDRVTVEVVVAVTVMLCGWAVSGTERCASQYPLAFATADADAVFAPVAPSTTTTDTVAPPEGATWCPERGRVSRGREDE